MNNDKSTSVQLLTASAAADLLKDLDCAADRYLVGSNVTKNVRRFLRSIAANVK